MQASSGHRKGKGHNALPSSEACPTEFRLLRLPVCMWDVANNLLGLFFLETRLYFCFSWTPDFANVGNAQGVRPPQRVSIRDHCMPQ